MSFTLLSDGNPVAKKEYICEWCAEKILKGEKHYKYVGIYDGDFQSIRVHLECEKAMRRELSEYDECEFSECRKRGKTYEESWG